MSPLHCVTNKFFYNNFFTIYNLPKRCNTRWVNESPKCSFTRQDRRLAATSQVYTDARFTAATPAVVKVDYKRDAA